MRRAIVVLVGIAAITTVLVFVLVQMRHRTRPPLAGMPAVLNSENLYSEAGAGRFSPVVRGVRSYVFVPNVRDGDVTVIDPDKLQAVRTIPAGRNPQHVVPAYDLKTLWVAGSAAPGHGPGMLMPLDPRTLEPGRIVPVPDAYNLYFEPDGRFAIDVAEQEDRLDFRDPATMAFRETLSVPECRGINHADFSGDGSYAIFSCEFGGNLVKFDVASRSIVAELAFPQPSMPQDVRVAPDGETFYVADMMRDGVSVVDGETLRLIQFIPTGIGTHGLFISRDGKRLFVANRGSHVVPGRPRGPGSISVIDFAQRRLVLSWPIPGGGSPDMGNVSADGRYLWLSGRFDDVVYRVNTRTGAVVSIPVGREPHGVSLWPQPGRYSLGHTGIMR